MKEGRGEVMDEGKRRIRRGVQGVREEDNEGWMMESKRKGLSEEHYSDITKSLCKAAATTREATSIRWKFASISQHHFV